MFLIAFSQGGIASVEFAFRLVQPIDQAVYLSTSMYCVSEEEAVVELVQKGVGSRFYDRGRYSPARETGTHPFHQLIAAAIG